MKSMIDQIHDAVRVATPLIAISTADPAATMQSVRARFEQGSTPKPMFRWDASQGLVGLNKTAHNILLNLLQPLEEKDWPGMTSNPGAALSLIGQLPGEQREVPADPGSKLVQRSSMVFALNLHRYLEDGPGQDNGPVVQATWNLRDTFKRDRRTLIILGPGPFKFPPEIQQDIIVFDEPLPGDNDLNRIVQTQAQEAGLGELKDDIVAQAIDALRGLPSFTAEQVTAMSLTKDGLDVEQLWARKISVLEQTPGLTIDRGTEDFDQAGGLEHFKRFGAMLAQGKNAPLVYVRLDELEKMLGGIGTKGAGDNTGVSQDALGVLLREMEDNGWPGLIALGHAGCGKSLITKALANTASKITGRRVLSIAADLGAMKDSLLGKSEQMIRRCMKVIKGLAGSRVCFVATCNDIDIMPPALRRRFRLGIWMFDLPEKEEREAIWKINLAKYGIKNQKRPADAEWTGSDIRNVCEAADRLGITLEEATKYVSIPVAKSDPAAIERLRRAADGKYLSASYPGPYRAPQAEAPKEAQSAGPRRSAWAKEV